MIFFFKLTPALLDLNNETLFPQALLVVRDEFLALALSVHHDTFVSRLLGRRAGATNLLSGLSDFWTAILGGGGNDGGRIGMGGRLAGTGVSHCVSH